MFRWLICALALLLLATPAAVPAAEETQVDVTVTRGTNGDWVVEYRFGPRSPVWFFPRSSNDDTGGSWRVKSWTVETPGVRLRRVGRFDALDGGSTPLTRVRIRMRPYSEFLPSDFTPAVRFSDGGIAFLSDNFTAIPGASAAKVQALPADLNDAEVYEPTIRLAFNDPARRLVIRGKPSTGSASLLMASGNTYVYAGDTPVTESRGFAGMLDTGLPNWIRTELTDFTPKLLEYYTRKLGAARDPKPIAMVAWGGVDQTGWLLNARVLDGMIMMQVSGESAAWRDPHKVDTMRAFIGHEAAHLWLGRTLDIERSRDRWITEGGADFLSVRALEALDPDFDTFGEFRKMMNDCLSELEPGVSVAVAGARIKSQVYYGCGAMLSLAAEYATKKRYPWADSFEFYRGLMYANRFDRTTDSEDWLKRFEAITRDKALTEEVRGFVLRGSSNPRAFFKRLFAATGVPLAVEEISIKELLLT